MICIEVEGLTKQFGPKKVVDGLSFSLPMHTSTALIGPNGAGKTTALSMLAHLMEPTSGKIIMPNIKDMRSAIGFLPQYPQFYSWLTALEYMEMVASLSNLDKRTLKSECKKMLSFVGLEGAMNKKTVTFSGGMKQRLGIAQALVHKPKLLLLDEPVSALDPVGRREVMNLLKEVQEQTTILYSTHILNDAEEMTDQLLFLRDGQLVEQGSLQRVKEKFQEPRYKITFSHENEAQQFTEQTAFQTQRARNIVYVEILEDRPTMQQLLYQLAVSPCEVLKVERETASLEEIFMKVAGENATI
ncbi:MULTISPECIES: ABC transporter ATP-binding protein [Solibacillus]|uniref:ABC transporter ATP-binding protein n=1 Tax=Solibacillus faecavium TaxID=2762221 RepID=A0ABR8Y3D5_9BACL|nr:ABC transporter ATP-binding protein [Solibacillus faecavium]MBD8038618.1 ABC transporter ATP-binding protein [Solibacillus faecavium]